MKNKTVVNYNVFVAKMKERIYYVKNMFIFY